MAARLSSRRSLLAGTGAVAGAALLDAWALEPNWLEVSAHEVPVDGLPRSLDGFGIAQITDAHLQKNGLVEAAMAEEIERRNVQLVVLTGDIVDGRQGLPALKELCGTLRKKGRTVLATLGNWEHWGKVPSDELRAAYGDSGVELLVNASSTIDSGLDVVATDDSTAGSVNLAALADTRNAPAQLFLTHSPALLDQLSAASGRFDLALAGHTHGGQVTAGPIAPWRPPGSGRFVAGWYDVMIGRAYVSRGTGTSVAPLRFMCRPELPIFTLRQG